MKKPHVRLGLVGLAAFAIALAWLLQGRECDEPATTDASNHPPTSSTPALNAAKIAANKTVDHNSAATRSVSEMSPREYLAIGNPPTRPNVLRMLTAIHEAGAPWDIRWGILALLLETSLDLESDDPDSEEPDSEEPDDWLPLDELDANSALLVLSHALSVLSQPGTPNDDRRQARAIAEQLLIGMWKLGSDRQDLIAQLLIDLDELPPHALSHLTPLSDREEVPEPLLKLLRFWRDRFGGDGVDAMLSLVDHPDLDLSCIAIGFLMQFDPDQYLPMVIDRFEKTDRGSRSPLFYAITKGLPTADAVTVLTTIGKGVESTSMTDAAHLWNALGGALLKSEDPAVLDLLRDHKDAGAREQMLMGIGASRPQMLESMLTDPEFSNARGRVLISLSHQTQSPRIAELTRETLHANDDQRGKALIAASVLCQLAADKPWIGSLKTELETIGRDPKAEMRHRSSAIRALRKTMSDEAFQVWISQLALPDELLTDVNDK